MFLITLLNVSMKNCNITLRRARKHRLNGKRGVGRKLTICCRTSENNVKGLV